MTAKHIPGQQIMLIMLTIWLPNPHIVNPKFYILIHLYFLIKMYKNHQVENLF